MNYRVKSINPDIIGDYTNIEYPDRRQFPDDETVNRWKSLGHLYVNYTGLLREEYRGVPQWCHDIVNEIKKEHQVKNTSLSVYCMPPGTIMPEHQDTYPRYRKVYNIEDQNNVCRFLIFLNDWKSGHYFELNRTPIVNWKKGDCYMWRGDAPHMAANLGDENRYTMQITATI
jgi:hypothetical protein